MGFYQAVDPWATNNYLQLGLYSYFLILSKTSIIALILSTISQRFPAPWAKGNFHAPMVKPGIFGLPLGTGYEEKKEN